MICGLTAGTESTSMPSLGRARGRKFVRKTSLVRMSSCSTRVASGFSRDRPMLRLPRLGPSIIGAKLDPCEMRSWPRALMRPRPASPRSACSTLMTSAPQSARTAPADGTKVNCATSRTRTPAMGLSTGRDLVFPLMKCRRPAGSISSVKSRWSGFDEDGSALPGRGAHGGHAQASAAPPQLIGERVDHAGAGGRDRVPDAAPAPVDVDQVLVDAQFLARGNRNGREGLVDLPQGDVRHRVPSAVEHPPDGVQGAIACPGG